MQTPVSPINLDTDLLYDASNFVNIINYYKSADLRYIKTYKGKLQQIIHDLQDIDVVNMHDKLYLKLYVGDKQFHFADMSEGTIKAMALNLILNLPFVDGTKPLLTIDEPEANLHPAWQKVVGQWMLTSDTFQQLFVSTHSPDFLDTFTESFKMGDVSVFVFDTVQGIKEIRYEQIKDDLEDWELGDLYRVNDPALGGWPW